MPNKSIKPYTTIAFPGADTHAYHDRDSLPFNAMYPLVEFKDEFIDVAATPEMLHRQILQNYWFQKANIYERQEMRKRVEHLNANLQIVLDFIDKNYKPLGFEVVHISIAGSYAHAAEPGDIDFDVVLTGSFFDYVTFNEGLELLDITGKVQKVSLTLMGIDNVLGKQFIADDIRNNGFVHHDTIIREMLVAPMRNITVYGKPFDHQKNVDSRNVLVRIARQLYFAELTLEGKIPYYDKDPLKTRKAVKRIKEAYEIIDWLLQTSNDLRKK
ncbi:MAG TPA: hypothetical protein VH144_03685 [Candidatus Saccharimonadales bacterium]|jgi:hypothetical protein|nr:hypothetical protein [Candidatus Saccharimonadales bacterium]